MRQMLFNVARFSAVLLILTTTAQAIAYAAPAMDAMAVKQQLMKRGVGNKVKIEETDEKSFRGKIISLGDTSVTLQDGSKPPQEIPFTQVAGIHGPGLSKGATILVVVGGVVIVVVIVAAILASRAKFPATIPI